MVKDKKPMLSLQIVDKLSEELVKEGIISKSQLLTAKETQKEEGGNLGHILVKKSYITENKLLDIIAKKLSIPTISLADYTPDQNTIKLLPLSYAKKYKAIAIFKIEEVITIATSDPMNIFALDDIRGILKSNIEVVIATEKEIDTAIEEYYRGDLELITDENISVEIMRFDEGSVPKQQPGKIEKEASGTEIVSLVNNIIASAYRENASDIHIEPMSDLLKIRFRIDGVLEEIKKLPSSLFFPIASRIKIIANMDVAERRIPQDGRVAIKINENMLDLRISSYPTINGETLAMRLLTKGKLISLDDLGFSSEDKETFAHMISKPHGMILVTGPTGSGKSTTLYAALSRVNTKDKHIISIEDPIENEIDGINQAQVNLKAGLTFASALKSMLRQDPDIIMVGEIRDQETADIAIRAGMTGHLVFSTLHTNNALGAITRLADLDVEPFLISSGIIGVIAQRLVRRICPNCKTNKPLISNQFKNVGIENLETYYGEGCRKCRMTGYSGRLGIFEVIEFDEEIRSLINKKESETDIEEFLANKKHKTIVGDGIEKIRKGITTIDEVLRVTMLE